MSHARAGRGVGHRLERRERLRADDEEGLRRLEIARRLDEVGGVDIGHEAEGKVPRAEVLQGLIRHDRPEVRTPDADVHDVADALAGGTPPRTGADSLGEVRHAIEHRVHLRDDIDAVDDEVRVPGIRNATCSAARSSVTLMCSPRNMASIRSRRPHSRARSNSSDRVSSVSRCFE